MSRLRIVDGLRGLAAMVVVFHHVFTIFPNIFNVYRVDHAELYNVASIISELNVSAVMLFFVISGFSIRLSTQRLDLKEKRDLLIYACKRVSRLVPLYLFAIGLTAVLAVVSGKLGQGQYGLTTFLGNLFFMQTPVSTRGNWFAPYGDNYPLWSLSFEMWFYLIYPAHIVIANTRSTSDSRVMLLQAACVSATSLIAYQLLPNPFFLFLSHYFIWFLGVDLAESYLAGKATLIPGVAGIIALGVMVMALSHYPSATGTNIAIGVGIYTVWSLLATEYVRDLLPVRFAERVFSEAFESLGDASYAIYLFHYPIFVTTAWFFTSHSVSSVVSITILMILVSMLIENIAKQYRYVLVPCNRAYRKDR